MKGYNYLQMSDVLNEMNTYYSYSFETDYEPLSQDQVRSAECNEDYPRDQQFRAKNTGHWNHTQKEMYFYFLKDHRENFIKKETRRTDKIFKVMARYIRTRAADQCRSHHQKMEKKFGTIDAILASAESEVPLILAEVRVRLELNNQNSNFPPQQFYNCQAAESRVAGPEAKMDYEPPSQLLSYQDIEKLEQGLNQKDIFSKETFNVSNDFLM